ncbi:MAG: TonB-dependent receptor [Chitinophagaceae bacterium]|nr:TonB-dependent receptor [Chitinophagaceae bacterium]
MKHAFLLTSLFFLTFLSYGQFPSGAAGSKTGQPMNIGHVYGRLVDTTGKSIDNASVLLMQRKFDTTSGKMKELLLKGTVTNSKGEFNLEELPLFGSLELKISATGYKPVAQKIVFKAPVGGMGGGQPAPRQPSTGMGAMLNGIDQDLGNIQMKPDASELENVTVTASAPLMRMDIDKKVFNVEKNLVSAGGTALDVMRNVPSLQVDIDGNVKLRNAEPQLFVDGRPTTLSLDQIPADAIQSVEVITNPSAKFDASGGNAGILNIILKKNKKTGYNGNLMAGVDRRGGFNGGGGFNAREGKINISATVMGNKMRNRTDGTTMRNNYGDTTVSIFQGNDNRTNGGFLFGRLGFDYFITNRTTLSAAGIKVHGRFKPRETIDISTDSLFENSKSTVYSQRLTSGSRTFNATGLQLGMKHNFPKAGEELTADLNYFGGKNKGDNMTTTNYLDAPGSVKNKQMQQVTSEGDNESLTIQTDYVKPLTEKTKIETGLRAQLRSITNNNATYIQAPGASDFVKIGAATNNYKNRDNVYAAYLSVTSAIKNFGYQLGLRAERSDYKADLTNTGQKFGNTYPISLFPSVFLSQKLKKDQTIQLNYTRRVSRPNFFQLIPYIDYTDSLNITRGNPALVPEFTHSLEASYGKTFKGNNTILTSLYYKHTDNLITRFLERSLNPVSNQEDLINTYINASSSYSYGAEFTSTNTISKKWDLTTNINVYNSRIRTDNIQAADQEALWSVFGKFNTTYKFPKNFSFQLSADFQSKTNLPINRGGQNFGPPSQAQSSSQGYIKPFWGMDAAVKKTFLANNAAAVSLSMSDIFRTRKSDQYSYGSNFDQQYYRLTNPQMIRLNFTYRFGKMDISLLKRQNMKGQAEGMQNATNMQ